MKLVVTGTAKLGSRDVVREALAAEDRMQAFLWRHLVPASELMALVVDPRYQPTPKRPIPSRPPVVAAKEAPPTAAVAAVPATADSTAPAATVVAPTPPKPKFTKQQIAGRLRQLKLLYEEGLLTDAFYDAKVAECETGQ